MFRHILFPVDFSPQCADAVKPVRTWVERHKANLTLVHTIEFGHRNYVNWYAYVALVDLESVRNDARRRLKDFAASGFHGIPCHAELVEGEAPHMIVDYARNHGVDLIMMPTTGQGRLHRLLVGSVTAKVLYDSECPVWTDAHHHGAERGEGPILCAIDGSPRSEELLKSAARLGEAEGATIKVVHVQPELWLEAQPGPLAAMHTALEAEMRKRIEALQSAAGTALPTEILFGDLAVTLQSAVQREKARLLVIGRGHMHAVLGRTRTHVNSIIERAPCPVLSI